MNQARPLRLLQLLLSALLLALPLAAQPTEQWVRPAQLPTEEPSITRLLRQASSFIEYGDNLNAVRILESLVRSTRLELIEQRREAYKMLGVAHFALGQRDEAAQAFLELALLDPDYELDPFYETPQAVSFFDEVKRQQEGKLAPVRARKRAEAEARRKAIAQEEERRLLRQREEEEFRLRKMASTLERRYEQHLYWVNLLPLGAGQFQNGDQRLGLIFAGTQLAAAAVSAVSYWRVEQLRDPFSGKFVGSSHDVAVTFNVVKWASGAVFLGLWAAGAIQASSAYQRETLVDERLVTQQPLPPPSLPPNLQPLFPGGGRPPAPATPPAPAPAARGESSEPPPQ